MSNNKKNRLQQFVDSLPSCPESDSQFAMVISADSSSYGGDNTLYCSNSSVEGCSGTNGVCTNYKDACAGGVNVPNAAKQGCKNLRTEPGQIGPDA